MMTERQAIARAELLNTLAEQERENDMLMMHFYKMEECKRQARRVLARQQKEEIRTIPFPLDNVTETFSKLYAWQSVRNFMT